MKRFPSWLLGERAISAGSDADRLFDAVEQILDAIDEGVVVHDPNRRIFLFNRAAERLTGWERERVLGRDCQEIFPPDGICGSHCRFPEGSPADGQRPVRHEVVFTDRQGEQRRIQVSVRHLESGLPGRRAVVAVLGDVTEVSQLRWQMKEKYSFHGMVGRSAAMRDVFTTIRQVTGADYPVLITGESGTGKELVARATHNESRRQTHPFVPINCGALPVPILESELFGHVRGAFTGAIRDKKGRFELAHGGTLFLDEVGELDPAFQVKLLRVLQEKRFERVGGERSIEVDVRIISATNRDPLQLVERGAFRQDLYYRLSVVPIHLPPLRDRRADIPLLVEQILESVRQETGKDITSVSDEAMDSILAHHWPGNVRELINALQLAAVRTEQPRIEAHHLPPEVRGLAARLPTGAPHPQPSRRRIKLDGQRVHRALAETGGNKVQAAKLLGVGRATLYRFLAREHGK